MRRLGGLYSYGDFGMTARYTLAALIALTGIGCKFHFQVGGPARVGSGIVAKQIRQPGQFHRIQAGGAAQLVVTVEDKVGVEIEIDDNLLDIVVVETRGDTLVIRTNQSYNSRHGLKVRLSTPDLMGLDLSGAARAEVEGVNAQDFALELSGASSATVSGTVKTFKSAASGASKIHCFELATQKASLSLSGASSAELDVSESLNVNASGASKVKYKGNPDHVERKISGASTVQSVSTH
jgi:hypothetical protein